MTLPLPGEGIPTPACLGQDQEGFFMAHFSLWRQAQSEMWGPAQKPLLSALGTSSRVSVKGFCQGFLGSHFRTPSEQVQSG